jgi:glycosyltransferase involved in cell wall biosynthesis
MLILNEVISDARVIRAARALQSHCDLKVLAVDTLKTEFDYDTVRAELGFDVEWVPMKYTGKLPRNIPGYFARYGETMARMVARGCQLRPALIHAHECDTLPIAMAIRAATRAKIVYDAHELYRDTTYARQLFLGLNVKAWLESWAMRYCDAIIACNSFRAEIMHNEYGAPFLPAVVRNVPPYAPYEPTNLLRAFVGEQNPKVDKIVLYQGGLMPGRGMETCIQAVTHLADNVGLVFLGGGGEAYIETLRELARTEGVADRVFFHPKVPYDVLARYTSSADIGIVTYQNTCRNNYYCAPNKLYEYSAAGLPQVGSDLPPVEEFFDEFSTGTVFEEANAVSLAEAVNEILSDEAQFQTYRQNCLNAARVMCWENESQNLLRVYRRLIERKAL